MGKISLIIPCYNERDRIRKTLSEVVGARHVEEIIVVDDGSDELTKKVLMPFCKNRKIKIFTHLINMGKTAALQTGISRANNDNIFLLDADLNGLKSFQIDGMIRTYWQKKVDVLLGDRERELWILRKLGFSIAFTGERIFNKNILDSKTNIFKLSGYLFEPAFNLITFKNYSIGKYVLYGVGQAWKIQKDGLKGLSKDLIMHYKYISFLGIKEYLLQGIYCMNI